MAYPALIPPAPYRIASGERAGAPGELAYYILRQDDRDADCWREVAGPFVARGGAIQRLDRIIARELAPTRRRRTRRDITRGDMTPGDARQEDASAPDRDITDRDMTEGDITLDDDDARAGA